MEIQQISPLVAKPDKALISLLPAKSANGSQGAPVDLGGVAVFGAFTTASGRARLEGVMSGSRLDFNWAAPGDGGAVDSGSGHFDVSADCNFMKGAYRGNKSGSQDLAWQARRVVVADNRKTAPSYETSRADLRQRGGAVLAALSQQAGKLRRLDGLTKTLGSNVADIFALVRNQIAFAPYPGILRGAQGVLNAGSGNSYDQALLLAALLKAKGHQVRFATGTLSADDALKLVGSYDGGKPAPEAPGLDTQLYSAAGFTDAEIAANSTQAAEIADRIGSEAQNYAGLVTKLIADQRPDALPDPAKMRQASRDDARDHAWVQVLENGKWMDLDPSFPGAQIGQVFAEPAQVLDEFPHDLDQAVDIKLTAERIEGGKIATETVGNWHVRVASLSDAASPGLQLRFAPLNSGAALSRKWQSDEIEAAGAYYLDKALNTGNIFQPALVANDGTVVPGQSFSLSGKIVSNDLDTRMAAETHAAVQTGFKSATNALNSLFGPSTAPAASSALSGLRVDYEIVVPGRPPRHFERWLVDLIGPQGRNDPGNVSVDPARWARVVRASLAEPVDMLITSGPTTPAFVATAAAHDLETALPYLERVLAVKFGKSPFDIADFESQHPLPLSLLSLARDLTDLAANLAQRPGFSLVQSEPHLLTLTRGLTPVGDTNEVKRSWRIDLVDVAMRAMPTENIPAGYIMAAQSYYGMWATAMEAQTADQAAQWQCSDCGATENKGALALLDAAGAGTNGLMLLDKSQAPTDPVSPAEKALADDIARGNLVLVPRAAAGPVQAWITVDPTTGDTLGMTAIGGEGHVEYAIIVTLIIICWPLEAYLNIEDHFHFTIRPLHWLVMQTSVGDFWRKKKAKEGSAKVVDLDPKSAPTPAPDFLDLLLHPPKDYSPPPGPSSK